MSSDGAGAGAGAGLPVKRARTLPTCGVCSGPMDEETKDCVKEHWCFVGGKYVCVVCWKESSKKSDALKHSRIHTGARPYTCKHCGKGFTQQSNLKKHVSLVHDKDGAWRCPHPTCGYNTACRSILKQHVFGVHAVDREHECPHRGCAAAFFRRSNLNAHIVQIHTSIRSFKCTVLGCAASFKLKKDLTKHSKNVHSITRKSK